MEKTALKRKRSYLDVLLILCMITTIIFTFFIGHADERTITGWGYDLLMSIKTGQLSDFPAYTYEMHGQASNYTLFVNLITAIFLLPLFIIDNLFSLNIILNCYVILYKAFILLAVIHAVRKINIMCMDAGIFRDPEEIKILDIFFLSSAILEITVVGKGQVDIFSLLLLLYGLDNAGKESYLKASVFFGLSVLIKPFSLLIAVPVLLLLLEKYDLVSLIKNLFLTLLPYGINFLIQNTLMPEYRTYAKKMEEIHKELFGNTRMEQLFSVRWGELSCFFAALILISALCWYLGVNKKVKRGHYIIFPVLMYLSLGIFMSFTMYWFVLILPFLCVMVVKKGRLIEGGMLFLLMNAGVIGKMFVTERSLIPSPVYTFLSDIFPIEQNTAFWDFLWNRFGFLWPGFNTAALMSIALILLLYIAKWDEKKKTEGIAKEEMFFITLPFATLVLELIAVFFV